MADQPIDPRQWWLKQRGKQPVVPQQPPPPLPGTSARQWWLQNPPATGQAPPLPSVAGPPVAGQPPPLPQRQFWLPPQQQIQPAAPPLPPELLPPPSPVNPAAPHMDPQILEKIRNGPNATPDTPGPHVDPFGYPPPGEPFSAAPPAIKAGQTGAGPMTNIDQAALMMASGQQPATIAAGQEGQSRVLNSEKMPPQLMPGVGRHPIILPRFTGPEEQLPGQEIADFGSTSKGLGTPEVPPGGPRQPANPREFSPSMAKGSPVPLPDPQMIPAQQDPAAVPPPLPPGAAPRAQTAAGPFMPEGPMNQAPVPLPPASMMPPAQASTGSAPPLPAGPRILQGDQDPEGKVLTDFAKWKYGQKFGDILDPNSAVQPVRDRLPPPGMPLPAPWNVGWNPYASPQVTQPGQGQGTGGPRVAEAGGGLVMSGAGGGARFLSPVQMPDGTVKVVEHYDPMLKAPAMNTGSLGMMANPGQAFQDMLNAGMRNLGNQAGAADRLMPGPQVQLTNQQAFAKTLDDVKKQLGIMTPEEQAHAYQMEGAKAKIAGEENVANIKGKADIEHAKIMAEAQKEAAMKQYMSGRLQAIAPMIAQGMTDEEIRSRLEQLSASEAELMDDRAKQVGKPVTGPTQPTPPMPNPNSIPEIMGGPGSTPAPAQPPPLPGDEIKKARDLGRKPVITGKDVEAISGTWTGGNVDALVQRIVNSPLANTPAGYRLIANAMIASGKASIEDVQRLVKQYAVKQAKDMYDYDVTKGGVGASASTNYLNSPVSRTYDLGPLQATVSNPSGTISTDIADMQGGTKGYNAWHYALPLAGWLSGHGHNLSGTWTQQGRNDLETRAKAAAQLHQALVEANALAAKAHGK